MRKQIKNTALVIGLLSLININTYAQNTKTNVEEIMVDGFKVIYRPSVNQIVSVRLFIKGGTANYNKAQEGIENMAIAIATEGGTGKYAKEDYNRLLEKMGSTINGNSSYDYGNIALNCILKNFNNSWNIFEDVILSPSFTEEEFNKQKEVMISNVKQNNSNPDTYLEQMVMTDAFANLNYDKKPNGSEESLSKMTLTEVKNYYKNILNKKQCFLVVVGKVDKNDLIEKVKRLTKGFPEGTYTAPKPSLLSISQSTLNTEERKMATNYIRGIINAPLYGTQEGYATQIAFGILYDRLFNEIRTQRSLSYAPGAFYTSNLNPFGNLYVSTTDPKQAIQVMIDELRKIKKEGFTEEEIRNQKSSYVTAYYMQTETNAAQTQSLGANEIKSGTWRSMTTYIDNINKVPSKQINEVFNKYVTAIRWSYLGDLSKVDSKVFLQKL